jgi:hypothetical protein
MMKFLRICCWEIVAIISLGALGPLPAQTTSESAPSAQAQRSADQKSRPKAGRTWTNDDLTSLRTTADTYKDQRDSVAKKPPETSTSETHKNALSPGEQPAAASDVSLPDNTDAVEALIQRTEEDIHRKQGVFDEASADVVRAGSDLERSVLQSNVQIAKVDVDSSKDELKLLRARVAQLKSKSTPASEPTKTSSDTP